MSVMYRSLPIAVLCLPLLAEDRILEHSRQVNLERAAHMPNFIADEILTGYADRDGSGRWKRGSTVEDEITVKGNQITRQHIRQQGFLRHGLASIPGFRLGMPATGFAAALQPLFDPSCPTTILFGGNDELRGKAVLVYTFYSPANGCFGNLYGRFPYNSARQGRILIDGPRGDVLQFEEKALGFPQHFGFRARYHVMTWDNVKIGEAFHWLPVSADFIWDGNTPGRVRAAVEYKNHRHFESTTDIKYK